jgi:hypothetical protein
VANRNRRTAEPGIILRAQRKYIGVVLPCSAGP